MRADHTRAFITTVQDFYIMATTQWTAILLACICRITVFAMEEINAPRSHLFGRWHTLIRQFAEILGHDVELFSVLSFTPGFPYVDQLLEGFNDHRFCIRDLFLDALFPLFDQMPRTHNNVPIVDDSIMGIGVCQGLPRILLQPFPHIQHFCC